jgi:hypothetical protein
VSDRDLHRYGTLAKILFLVMCFGAAVVVAVLLTVLALEVLR